MRNVFTVFKHNFTSHSIIRTECNKPRLKIMDDLPGGCMVEEKNTANPRASAFKIVYMNVISKAELHSPKLVVNPPVVNHHAIWFLSGGN